MLRTFPLASLVAAASLLLSPALDAQSVFGRNLVVNGDAETGPSDANGHAPVTSFPGWQASGTPDVVQYASGYDIGPTDSHALNSGNAYFAGGRTQADAGLSQTIDLSSGAATIDGGNSTFALSGYLGGYQDEPETAQLTVTFLNAAGGTLSSATLGPVTDTDREQRSGLWYRRAIGQVPVGSRSAKVVLTMSWKKSSTNDGAADNLSLVLNTPVNAQSLLGGNLILNGNAEMPTASDPKLIDGSAFDVPAWSRTGLFTIDSYTDSNADLDVNSPGPSDRGNFYFYGGPGNALSSALQDIDVSSAASLIDAGTATYALSGWLGGYSSQSDNSTLTVQFQNWSGAVLGSTTLGPVSPTDRNNLSALLQLSRNGAIPTGTRVIRVSLTMTRTDGSDNDAMADSLSLILSAPASAGKPAITGVVSDASFTPSGAISSGSWVAIFGTGLAPAGESRKWNESTEIVNGVLPTSLDSTSVTVNGKAAVVEFIQPSQINIQPPDDTAVGPVQVVVTTPGGTSNSFTVNYATFAPGLFPATAPYVVAQHADNSYVTTASPAKPGEVIILWGTGFGPANPAVAAGKVFSGANPLANTTTVTIGGQNAVVDFAGVVGAGLIQINVHVPAGIGNGDAAVVASIGGASTQTTSNMITIHN